MSGSALRVVGLDLSLKSTGVCEGTRMDVIRCHDSIRSHERIAFLWGHITTWTRDADLVVIEGPSFGSASLGGHEEMAWLRGHVMQRLWAVGIPFAVVPPSSLKMFATGNGSADKDAMLLAAEKAVGGPITGPVKPSAYDMADAFWLAALGRYALDGFPEHGRLFGHDRHREAAAGVDWSRAADLLDGLGIGPPEPKPKPKKRRRVPVPTAAE